MNDKIFIVHSCKYLNWWRFSNKNCSIYHHLLQKFKYCEKMMTLIIILCSIFWWVDIKEAASDLHVQPTPVFIQNANSIIQFHEKTTTINRVDKQKHQYSSFTIIVLIYELLIVIGVYQHQFIFVYKSRKWYVETLIQQLYYHCVDIWIIDCHWGLPTPIYYRL